MNRKLIALPILLLMIMVPIVSAAGAAGSPAVDSIGNGQAGRAHPEVRYASRYDRSPRLRDIRPVPPRAGQLIEIHEDELPNRVGGGAAGDGALQSSAPVTSSALVGANFEGINNLDGVLPPDTNGDVGPDNYVQTVNLHYAVWDKAGHLLYGPVTISTLWVGFGGVCETSNDGDPIVQYDHLADRWMISQFALPNYPFGPFYQCIAVSQTSDPTGAFYRYQFTVSSSKMNDYPKFGVWPDAYYMSVNQFKQASGRWAGAGAVAFERSAMLAGQNARMVYFDLYNVDSNLGGMLPADLDGPAPPSGAPNIFAQMDDDSFGYSGDQVQLWNFHVDWNNPNASSFTHDVSLGTAPFDSNMCGYARNCIPQPGGTNVDAISDRLMYRLQYRNFGDHQSLVVSQTVDTNGSDHAGVRWYEIKNDGSGWSIYQQGTFAPDSANRWMGSAAMNGVGDIALGYSVSSASVYPSVRFTGRLAGDPRGQMTQGEGTIVDGSGYQTHSSGRWGDYSSLSVDPVDDCTFWYTQEYYAVVGSAPWQTRVGSFKLADCTPPATPTPGPSPTPTASSVPPSPTATSVPPTATPAPTNTSVPPTPTATVPPISNSVHIGDLDGFSFNNGKTWQPVVTILVHDASEQSVAGATVSGSWSSGASGTASCITGSSGTCQVIGPNVRKNVGSVTFMVTNVTSGGSTYDSAANHDPDGDSNGTTIVVSK
jgi:hypothetical protein